MPSTILSRSANRVPVQGRLLVVAIFLVALNLRATLASLPPLVQTIREDLELSAAVAGLLTTLPVLAMGVFAPVAQRLAHRIGREATVAVALVVLLIGLLVRLGGEILPFLFLGTLLGGAGIALCGTVLPGIVKEFFAHRPGMVTGVYLFAMMAGATVAAAGAVPLADILGSWQRSLAFWSVLALLGLAAWLPVVRAVNDRDDPDDRKPVGALPWRSRTAWLLASFLALQSAGFYSQLAWISPSYEDRGWSARDAGLLLALFSIVQLVSAVAAPALADRVADRRWLVGASVAAALVGLIGLAAAPDAAPLLWVALVGIGQGGGFALGMVKLVDYAPTPAASARLSALVFLVSYSVASLGPFGFGALHDATGGYGWPFAGLAILCAVQLALVPRLRPGRLAETV